MAERTARKLWQSISIKICELVVSFLHLYMFFGAWNRSKLMLTFFGTSLIADGLRQNENEVAIPPSPMQFLLVLSACSFHQFPCHLKTVCAVFYCSKLGTLLLFGVNFIECLIHLGLMTACVLLFLNYTCQDAILSCRSLRWVYSVPIHNQENA